MIRSAVVTCGLDWFAQSGHGGKWSRDGRIDDPQYDGDTNPPGNYWVNTIGAGNLKGDWAGTGFGGKQNMWKWQIIQEFLYPITSQASMEFCKPIWAGLEWQVPGHEHCSTGVITEQFLPGAGNAEAMAEFEYLFDVENNDTSGGGGQGRGPKIPNPPKTGPDVGFLGHAKAVAAAKWMQTHHLFTAYMVAAHIERKGAFNPDKGGSNNGLSIEHFRDLNNAAPTVCFGFEGQPGHQADPNRGGFGTGAFGGTYGRTGYYTAVIGGLWDVLLGEGRNFWLFAGSDWHTREVPEYDSGHGNWLETRESADDFWSGDYKKDYVFVKPGVNPGAVDVLNGMRSGNSFIVQGDLITALEFQAKTNWHANIMSANAAPMGQALPVKPGKR